MGIQSTSPGFTRWTLPSSLPSPHWLLSPPWCIWFPPPKSSWLWILQTLLWELFFSSRFDLWFLCFSCLLLQEAVLRLESHYSAFYRELLAAYFAVKHLKVEALPCLLITSLSCNLCLRFFLPWSARQQRQLSYLSEFTSDLLHLPGFQNLVADALSHPSLNPAPPSFLPFPVSPLQPLSFA